MVQMNGLPVKNLKDGLLLKELEFLRSWKINKLKKELSTMAKRD